MPEQVKNSENFHSAFSELKSGKFELRDGDTTINTVGVLGEGGSKTVYDAVSGENNFALALPNVVDDSIVAEQKWNTVLQEPQKTSRIRELGLHTNPVCEIREMTVNGSPIQALVMMRYQDLPFEVRDSKNRRSSIQKTRIIPEEGASIEQLTALFDGIINDIETLLINGVRVGRDSFSIAIDKGKARLYLNDLGSSIVKPFERDEIPRVCGIYASYAISALIESLTEEEYIGSKPMFDEVSSFNSEFGRRLTEIILTKNSEENPDNPI